jgi:hypothetical protein
MVLLSLLGRFAEGNETSANHDASDARPRGVSTVLYTRVSARLDRMLNGVSRAARAYTCAQQVCI